MDTTKSKVQIANNKLDAMAGTLENDLLPVIAGLTPAIEAVGVGFGDLLQWTTKLLGIEPDEDKRAHDTRNRTTRLDELNRQMDEAANDPTHKKGVDAALLAAVKEDKAQEAGEAAAAEARVQKHIDDPVRHGLNGAFVEHVTQPIAHALGVTSAADMDDTAARKDKSYEARLLTASESTAAALSKMAAGGFKVIAPPPPPRAKTGGTMPAEAADSDE
jgi:hypothetical protein